MRAQVEEVPAPATHAVKTEDWKGPLGTGAPVAAPAVFGVPCIRGPL